MYSTISYCYNLIICNTGQLLSHEWLKYKYGVYPEHGYADDPIYPEYYSSGNVSLLTTGCEHVEYRFCPATKSYNRISPTKQNILCGERSALEVITDVIQQQLTSSFSRPPVSKLVDNSSITLPYESDTNGLNKRSIISTTMLKQSMHDPQFVYTLPMTTKYRILLDWTAVMGEKIRWTNTRRALHRFIDLLPVGSVLSVFTLGDSIKEVLPASIVTDLNRDGLFGR